MTKEDIRLQEMIVTLRTRLLVMCAETSLALENTEQALAQRDIGKATAVVEGDKAINALENEIDDRALSIFIRTKPMATDLRFVISALRMVTDLERIGDEAVSISEHIMLMRDIPQFEVIEDIENFMKSAQNAFDKSFDAFRNNDQEKAKSMSFMDAEVLQEEVRILQHLLTHFSKKMRGLDEQAFMHLILIVHSITRIWRRSINFAEQIYFFVEGVSLKHVEEEIN